MKPWIGRIAVGSSIAVAVAIARPCPEVQAQQQDSQVESPLSDTEVRRAIELGSKMKLEDVGLRLYYANRAGRILSTAHQTSLIAYTPVAWVERAAAERARQFRPLEPEDVSNDDRLPVLRVLTNAGLLHMVLRSADKTKVIQPISEGAPFEGAIIPFLGQSGMGGESASAQALLYRFPLHEVRTLMKGQEFLITCAGYTDPNVYNETRHVKGDVKVKAKNYPLLP